jgi:hypothetical protein
MVNRIVPRGQWEPFMTDQMTVRPVQPAGLYLLGRITAQPGV